MADVTKVSLGAGDLYVNGVNVGYLKGDVTFEYVRSKLDFRPSNELGPVRRFIIEEGARLKASLAEVDVASMRMAIGATAEGMSIDSSTSFPLDQGACSYEDFSTTGASYDVMKFGGSKTVDDYCVLFEHIRPNNQKIIICLYKAVTTQELILPFHETEFNLYDIEFEGLTDSDRDTGDKIGFIAEQVQGTSLT